jgi:mRNA export factor
VVSCFTPTPNGFAIGSIEGRCAIQYVEERDASNNFSFKCHRETNPNNKDQSNVYAVNAISFHPEHGTFSTAGSDGQFNFWDGQAKHRLSRSTLFSVSTHAYAPRHGSNAQAEGFPSAGAPITATDFNRQGTIFAYALSYDWSQGFQKNTAQQPHKVMLHAVNQDEVKPRPKAGGKR